MVRLAQTGADATQMACYWRAWTILWSAASCWAAAGLRRVCEKPATLLSCQVWHDDSVPGPPTPPPLAAGLGLTPDKPFMVGNPTTPVRPKPCGNCTQHASHPQGACLIEYRATTAVAGRQEARMLLHFQVRARRGMKFHGKASLTVAVPETSLLEAEHC